eukprot:Em0022g136a
MTTHCQVQRVLGKEGRDLAQSGHVGFDSLPDQLVNKAVSKGFDFNILCIGETGIGKSTLIDALFKAKFEDVPITHKLPQVALNSRTFELQESNVRLRLTVISTAGFGDQINKQNSCAPIVEYIDKGFENYLQEELKIKRDLVTFHDTRVHVCLYYLCPTGHSIKSLDLVCMKELEKKVNVIPIIAKADTISRSELVPFKTRIVEELRSNGVDIYKFPTDDETVAEVNGKMNKALSAKIDDFQFNQLFNSSSLADRARLLSISSPHASSWLSVVPSEGLGRVIPSHFIKEMDTML